MKLGKIISLIIIIPLLALDLFGIVIFIVSMVNKETDLAFGLLILFFLVFLAAMLIWGLLPMLRSDPLLRRGKQAVATVLEVWDTGVTVNELNIQVGLLLEVHPPGNPPYQVRTRTLVSRIQTTLYQPGMVVQVRYDPKNPEKVAIEGVSSRVGGGVAASPTGAMRNGTVIYQGRAYSSVDDLPAGARAKYKKDMSALADKYGDGIPDTLEGVVESMSIVQAEQSTDSPESDPAEKLRKLQAMLDEGLITQQEYEAKKVEILSRM